MAEAIQRLISGIVRLRGLPCRLKLVFASGAVESVIGVLCSAFGTGDHTSFIACRTGKVKVPSVGMRIFYFCKKFIVGIGFDT